MASGAAVALGYGPTPFVQDVALSTTLAFEPPLGTGASWLVQLHGELTVTAGGTLSATLSVSGSSGICRAGSYLELIGQ